MMVQDSLSLVMPWCVVCVCCLAAGACRNGHSESRRSRRLVLSFISTVVNYEYAFYWYLYQVRTSTRWWNVIVSG
jgi:hypothetical protein